LNIGIIDADLIDKGTNFPNLALMKISSYHKSIGDTVELLLDYTNLLFDKIYLAKVFDFTKIPINLDDYPHIEYNGTGFFYDKAPNLPDHIEHCMPDYKLYSIDDEHYKYYSIGYTTRGCFRKCSFCVNKKYDKSEVHSPINEFLDKNRKYICCLDDNVLACQYWCKIITELIETNKPFQFKQGIDIKLITKEKAQLLASAKYKGDYIFAFDHVEDCLLIDKKLGIWRDNCKKSTKLYVLCAFDSQDAKDVEGVFKRIKILFKNKCLPYIMRYKDYDGSPMRGMYITLARWCNQPTFVRKMTFREFCIKDNQSAYRYMTEFETNYPSIAKEYFDVRYSDRFKPKVIKAKYKIETTKISCRVETDKLNRLKTEYGNLTNTELIDRLINEKLSETI